MPVATLRFRLPEEAPEYRAAIEGGEYRNAVWELDKSLRDVTKYGTRDMPEPTTPVEAAERVRQWLRDALIGRGLDRDRE